MAFPGLADFDGNGAIDQVDVTKIVLCAQGGTYGFRFKGKKSNYYWW